MLRRDGEFSVVASAKPVQEKDIPRIELREQAGMLQIGSGKDEGRVAIQDVFKRFAKGGWLASL